MSIQEVTSFFGMAASWIMANDDDSIDDFSDSGIPQGESEEE